MKVAEAAPAPARRRFYDKDWLAALAVYRQSPLLSILLMGFSSGLPRELTFGSLCC
jgi:hypothetical protein